MKSESLLIWIESDGGPFLLLEENLLENWRGAFVESSQTLTSDYDRACTINDYVGIIEVGAGYGMVLGEEPFSTAWFQSPETRNNFLVRWVFAENELAVVDVLNNLKVAEWMKTNVNIQFFGGKLILFDSACNGSRVDEKLEIEIENGRYEVETLHYAPNKQTSLILHRFISLIE